VLKKERCGARFPEKKGAMDRRIGGKKGDTVEDSKISPKKKKNSGSRTASEERISEGRGGDGNLGGGGKPDHSGAVETTRRVSLSLKRTPAKKTAYRLSAGKKKKKSENMQKDTFGAKEGEANTAASLSPNRKERDAAVMCKKRQSRAKA